jgi:hypothetical protein
MHTVHFFSGGVGQIGNNDPACTIDERFERPLQPLKGISMKNTYVPELSYPTTKKIYKFKGAT